MVLKKLTVTLAVFTNMKVLQYCKPGVESRRCLYVKWSHVTNMAIVLPLNTDLFKGKYIKLDFFKNLVRKLMSEVQGVHFSKSKYTSTCSFLRIWSHLLNESFMENFILCAVSSNH